MTGKGAALAAVVIAVPQPRWPEGRQALSRLPGAERDGQNWRRVLGGLVPKDIDPHANHDTVEQDLTAAIKSLRPGGRLVVTFAGHGIAYPLTDAHGKEVIGYDQAVVVDDGPILNGLFGRMWRLRPDIEVLAIVDACHSADAIVRLAPDLTRPAENDLGLPLSDPRPDALSPAAGSRAALTNAALARFPTSTQVWPSPAARLLHVASSAADEKARETPDGGYFTSALLAKLQYSECRASIRTWLTETAQRLAQTEPVARTQTMNVSYVGASTDVTDVQNFLDSAVGFG
ncbi:MAG: caspase family protein [Actinomycetales bacterium]|nr:caspase family protein [Actinomycetales bacterium]